MINNKFNRYYFWEFFLLLVVLISEKTSYYLFILGVANIANKHFLCNRFKAFLCSKCIIIYHKIAD